jgi:rhodanese-related sulfurtransferase
MYRPAAWDERRTDAILPGHEIAVGAVRLRALATPGHRPLHLSFAVTDLSRDAEPWLVLSGDSLLVGDLARPDLATEAHAGATTLHSSIQALLSLGDHVEIWPAHVGGSLCGGAGLSSKTSSTIGFERRCNPLLGMQQQAFAQALIEGLPPRPPNVDRVVALNRAGDRAACPCEPVALTAPELQQLLLNPEVTVLDCRLPTAFDSGHLIGAVNLSMTTAGVGTRAGWALDPAAPIVIAANDDDAAHSAAMALHAVGLWQTIGYITGDGSEWRRAGLPVAEAGCWDLDQLVRGLRRESVDLVDVRDRSEWLSGHVPGSHHVPLHSFAHGHRVDLPLSGRTTAVACAAGIRAAFAASLLRRAGRRDVVRVAPGGVSDLGARGIGLTIGA